MCCWAESQAEQASQPSVGIAVGNRPEENRSATGGRQPASRKSVGSRRSATGQNKIGRQPARTKSVGNRRSAAGQNEIGRQPAVGSRPERNRSATGGRQPARTNSVGSLRCPSETERSACTSAQSQAEQASQTPRDTFSHRVNTAVGVPRDRGRRPAENQSSPEVGARSARPRPVSRTSKGHQGTTSWASGQIGLAAL